MLNFDAATTRTLNRAYISADFTARRRASFDALDPRPGETILDIGCGNGFLTAEVALAVGPQGRVIGLDQSADMLKAAKERCEDLAQVDFIEASADRSTLPDASVDKAVSVQVFEYFQTLDAPLAEAHRVIRPGGRLVVGDMHFGTACWHSRDPVRMDAMLRGWDTHLAVPDLPARLAPALRRAGFEPLACHAHTITDTVLKPSGLAEMTMILAVQHNVAAGLVSQADAQAWADEQRALAAEGAFFFSMTHFVWSARRI